MRYDYAVCAAGATLTPAPLDRCQTGGNAPDRSLRDQGDLDPIDWLDFPPGLHGTLGVEIPGTDCAALVTLDGVVACLRARLAQAADAARVRRPPGG